MGIKLVEEKRLEFLRSLSLLDTEADSRLDALTFVAKSHFDLPLALVSLVDQERLFFKSRQGAIVTETPRASSFCDYAIKESGVFVVPDTTQDDRFADYDLVRDGPKFRSYAGAPIIVDGFAVGTLCLLDYEPRTFSDADENYLLSLADMAAGFLATYKRAFPEEFVGVDPALKRRDEALSEALASRRQAASSQDFLQLILDTVPDVVFVKDSEFRIIQGNKAFFELFPEDVRHSVLGSTGTEEFDQDQVDAYLVNDREAFANGHTEAIEMISVLGGEERMFRSRKVSFENDRGEKFLLGVARDITAEAKAETELAEANAFRKLLFDSLPFPTLVRDKDFNIVSMNRGLLGLVSEEVRDEMIGTTGEQFFDKKELERLRESHEKALDAGSLVSLDRLQFPSGEVRQFRSHKTRFKDASGQTFVISMGEDITDQLEAEREKNALESFQNLMLDGIPDLIFVKDEEFRIVRANQSFLNVYPEEMRDSIIGTTTLEAYDEAEREQFVEQDRIALEHGYSETEESIQFPDGERRVLFTKKVGFENEEGQKFALAIGRDITELVEAREENEASLALLGNIFDAVSGAIIGLDVDKNILMINDAGRHMIGGRADETPFEFPSGIVFLNPEDLQPLESSHDPIARALIGHKIGGEVHLMMRGGSQNTRYVRVSSALVQSRSSPLHSVIVLDDVSEAEKNRQQLERQSRLDALGQLTGGIAHDFNNLLNTMQYAIELIRRDDLSERGIKSAEAALNSVSRGAELTGRLLAFAKKQPARATARELQEVFSELKGLVDSAIEASIRIDFPSVEPGLLIYCDQGQLQNAILNLVLNSRDAIMRENKGNLISITVRSVDALPAGVAGLSKEEAIYSTEGRRSHIQIEADREDAKMHRYIELSVSDNGPGMSKAVVSRALDPFFTTKGTNSGTGLGLSMVYGFVQQSDGEIRIYTEEGEGTAVKLFLPRGDTNTGLEGPVDSPPVVPGNGETLLIVEDEEFLLEQFDELLRELNYKTMLASSGPSALKLLKDGARPDLIITDIVMPEGMGGFELAKLARAIMPNVPVIYTSGYTGYTDEEMGEVVAPLLPKPSTPAMTSAQIRQALSEGKSNARA